jgi:hypothetical protein
MLGPPDKDQNALANYPYRRCSTVEDHRPCPAQALYVVALDRSAKPMMRFACDMHRRAPDVCTTWHIVDFFDSLTVRYIEAGLMQK